MRDATVSTIRSILEKAPEFTKALNNGAELRNPETLSRFIEDSILIDPAKYVLNTLSPVIKDVSAIRNNINFRENADKLFGELVKHGIEIDSLQHQLQEMNKADNRTAYAVDPVSTLPEMSAPRLQNRPAIYRRIDSADLQEHWYVGERELVIDNKNTLEIDEQQKDITKQISDTFMVKTWDVMHAKYDVSGRQKSRLRQPTPGMMRDSVMKKLGEEDHRFIISIDGLEKNLVLDWTEKLNQHPELSSILVYFTARTSENVIKMETDWYEAIDAYYRARAALGDKEA